MSDRSTNLFVKAVCDIRQCLAFYTVLPVGPGLDAAPGSFGSAQWAAPIAGAVVGLVAGGTYVVAQHAGLTGFVCAALSLAASILVTGALHEDGLADVADGFGGGRTVEQKLAIMKDSRIGTYGVLALVASFLLKLGALAAIGEQVSAAMLVVVLIAAHSASRSLIPLFMRLLPPARETGLAAGVGDIANSTVIGALGLGGATLLVCGIWTALVATALIVVWLAGFRWVARAQINGLTGDVLGTAQQGGEIIILIVVSALLAGQ